MTLVRITPANRGNLGPIEDNLPVYSRDVNQIITSLERASGMGIIAKLENVNLKTVAQNPLNWTGGAGANSASNTAPSKVVIVPKSGTYVAQNVSPIQAEASFIVNNDDLVNNDLIQVRKNATVIGTFMFTNGMDVDVIIDGIVTAILNEGYFAEGDSGADTVTSFGNDGASGNDDILSVWGRDENGNVFVPIEDLRPGFVTLINNGEYSGGVDAIITTFTLKLDNTDIGAAMSIPGYVPQLVVGSNIYSVPANGLYPSTGDYTFPVTTGTQDDFFIDIIIFGGVF